MSHSKPPAVQAVPKLSYAEFAQARAALREVGVSPKAASALANAGVTSLADLRSRVWAGQGGLREQLSQFRMVGLITLNEINKLRKSGPDVERQPRPLVTWETPTARPASARR